MLRRYRHYATNEKGKDREIRSADSLDLLARYFKNVLYKKNNRHSLRFHIEPGDKIFSKVIQDIILEAHSEKRYSSAIAICLTQEMFFLLLREYSSSAAYFNKDEFIADQSHFS